MNTLCIVLIAIASAIALITILFFLLLLICFRMTFYVTKKQKKHKDFDLPQGRIYKPYHAQILKWMQEAKTYKREKVSVVSYDGLVLQGEYYHYFDGAPIEIMFHGYRGSADRDLSGGIQRCYALKRNVLLVEQRSHGNSQGKVITFGIRERKDVVTWAEFAYNRFGEHTPLILTGISMGASTVLMASSLKLPKTVASIVADCGYNSPKEVICHVVKSMHLPVKMFYPIIKLSARMFGKFNIEETSAEKEVAKTTLPIIFLHGDSDDFVPCAMSEKNYQACASKKRLEIFSGAGHGMAYLVDSDRYIKALKDFENEYKSIE